MKDRRRLWNGQVVAYAVRSGMRRASPPTKAEHVIATYANSFPVAHTFAFAGFPVSAFRFTKGEPKIYKSSPIAERGFCRDCGSSLIVRYLEQMGGGAKSGPGQYWVGIGTLDHPEAVTLDYHYCVEGQLPWVHFDDDLPRTRCDEDPDLAATSAAAESKVK